MSEPKPQSLANHAKFVPPYHFVMLPLGLALLVWAGWRLFAAFSVDSVMQLVLVVLLLGAVSYARIFPLAVQDRLIRLEMRLRLQRLLPADLQGRIDELTPGQMVALRFASDDELPDLVQQVLSEGLRNRGEIKRRIKTWNPDYFRC